MADHKYTYSIDQFLNDKFDLSKLDREIRASDIVVALDYMSGFEDRCDIYFKAALTAEDWTTLSGTVANHDGEDDYVDYSPVKIVATADDLEQKVKIENEYRDSSGKLRMHQTSRKIGMHICWTGIGDDITDITKVGGGETLSFTYEIGDDDPLIKYIDFNIIENETWVHEGYMTWNNGNMDTLTLQLVPRTVTVSGVTGGDKTVYGGYLVVPTAPGSGNYEVVDDLTQPHGGLVYMPNNDLGTAPAAYWDADWNSSTGKFENIQPNYTGTGRYNIFSYEILFAEFVRQIPLLANGFIALNSSDTDQIGQGMRLKMIADTNNSVPDHDWSVACIMCLHRDHTV